MSAKLTSRLGRSPCIAQPSTWTGWKLAGSDGSVFQAAIAGGEPFESRRERSAACRFERDDADDVLGVEVGHENVAPPPAECAIKTAGPISSSSAEIALAATALPQ